MKKCDRCGGEFDYNFQPLITVDIYLEPEKKFRPTLCHFCETDMLECFNCGREYKRMVANGTDSTKATDA